MAILWSVHRYDFNRKSFRRNCLGLKNGPTNAAVMPQSYSPMARPLARQYIIPSPRYKALLSNEVVSAAVKDAGTGCFYARQSDTAIRGSMRLTHVAAAKNAPIFAMSNALGAAYCLACEQHYSLRPSFSALQSLEIKCHTLSCDFSRTHSTTPYFPSASVLFVLPATVIPVIHHRLCQTMTERYIDKSFLLTLHQIRWHSFFPAHVNCLFSAA
jgi:hypothetical protein